MPSITAKFALLCFHIELACVTTYDVTFSICYTPNPTLSVNPRPYADDKFFFPPCENACCKASSNKSTRPSDNA